jgi:hypothetical protein
MLSSEQFASDLGCDVSSFKARWIYQVIKKSWMHIVFKVQTVMLHTSKGRAKGEPIAFPGKWRKFPIGRGVLIGMGERLCRTLPDFAY